MGWSSIKYENHNLSKLLIGPKNSRSTSHIVISLISLPWNIGINLIINTCVCLIEQKNFTSCNSISPASVPFYLQVRLHWWSGILLQVWAWTHGKDLIMGQMCHQSDQALHHSTLSLSTCLPHFLFFTGKWWNSTAFSNSRGWRDVASPHWLSHTEYTCVSDAHKKTVNYVILGRT